MDFLGKKQKRRKGRVLSGPASAQMAAQGKERASAAGGNRSGPGGGNRPRGRREKGGSSRKSRPRPGPAYSAGLIGYRALRPHSRERRRESEGTTGARRGVSGQRRRRVRAARGDRDGGSLWCSPFGLGDSKEGTAMVATCYRSGPATAVGGQRCSCSGAHVQGREQNAARAWFAAMARGAGGVWRGRR